MIKTPDENPRARFPESDYLLCKEDMGNVITLLNVGKKVPIALLCVLPFETLLSPREGASENSREILGVLSYDSASQVILDFVEVLESLNPEGPQDEEGSLELFWQACQILFPNNVKKES